MKNILPSILKKSLMQRKQILLPSIRGPLFVLIAAVIFSIFLSIKFGPADLKEFHFVKERGAITVLSAIFLSMACGFAGGAFFLDKRPVISYRLFWLVAMAVFGFFAMDELMEFHEKIGDWLEYTRLGDSGVFRNWNDVIVIMYGIAGLLVSAAFLPEILRYPRFFELLCIAFAMYFFHTLIDSVSFQKTTMSVVCEESFKLFCSSFLMFSMFVGMLGIIGVNFRMESES